MFLNNIFKIRIIIVDGKYMCVEIKNEYTATNFCWINYIYTHGLNFFFS